MPDVGRPFWPPPPWFDNREGLPPRVVVKTEIDLPLVASRTVVHPISQLDIAITGIPSRTVVHPVLIDGAIYIVSGSFTVPPGVTTLDVECWGGGGSGFGWGHGATINEGAAGGGGGAFARGNVAVTPGHTYSYTVSPATFYGVGTPTNQDGGSTSFVGDGGAEVLAVGGTSGHTLTSGPGGLASACIGTTTFSGGNGGAGSGTAATGGAGGGGGAGSKGAGDPGTSASAGGPGEPGGAGGTPDGGAGGQGGAYAADVGPPTPPPGGAPPASAPGGGGGGTGGFGGFSGQGARGQIVISWHIVDVGLIPSRTVVHPLTREPQIVCPFIGSVTRVYPILDQKVSQVAIEVALSSPTLRVSQEAIEVVQGNAQTPLNVSQTAEEVLLEAVPDNVLDSQVAVEVLLKGVRARGRAWAEFF